MDLSTLEFVKKIWSRARRQQQIIATKAANPSVISTSEAPNTRAASSLDSAVPPSTAAVSTVPPTTPVNSKSSHTESATPTAAAVPAISLLPSRKRIIDLTTSDDELLPKRSRISGDELESGMDIANVPACN